MSAGEFERLMPGGWNLDRATQFARELEREVPPAGLRDFNRENAQSWRNHRWAMWRSANTAKWIKREGYSR